jgi:hypothetical protein
MMVLTLMFTIIFPLGLKAGAQTFTTTQVTLSGNYDFIGQYVNGQAFAGKGKTIGLLDESGNFTPLKDSDKYVFDTVSQDATTGRSITVNCINLIEGDVTTILTTSGNTYGYDENNAFWNSSNSVQLMPVKDKVSGKWGYAAPDGTLKIDCQYDAVQAFQDGVAKVKEGGLYGFINANGDTISSIQYIDGYTVNGYIVVWKPGWIVGVFDKNGNTIFPFGNYLSITPNYNCTLFAVENDSHEWGIVDRDGNTVINFNYRSLMFGYDYDGVSQGDTGLITAENDDGTFSFINTNGTPVFRESINLPYKTAATFADGFVSVMDTNNLWGLIDRTGNLVVPCLYDQMVGFYKGLAVVKKDGKYGVIDKAGNPVVPFEYDNMFGFSNDGLAVVAQGGLYGLIDTTGTPIVECQYLNGQNYGNGLTAFENSLGQWGVVDATGKTVVQFDNYDTNNGNPPFSFINGLSIVEKGGKYGLIDEHGNVIIDCNYDSLQTLDYKVFTASTNTGTTPVSMSGKIPRAVPLTLSGKTPLARQLGSSGVGSKYTVFMVQNASAAPQLGGVSASAGGAVGSTKVSATVDLGNKLYFLVSSSDIPTPNVGDPLPATATPYTSGSDITGVKAGQFVGVYEVNGNNKIVKFSEITLASGNIKAASGTGAVPNPRTDDNNEPFIPLALVAAGSACCFFIFRKHGKLMQKSERDA